MVKVSLKGGEVREFAAGATVAEIAKQIGMDCINPPALRR